MAPEDTLATLENTWSVTECNMTWKLQKSLHQPGTPSEAGDATQASTSEEAVSTFPTEGTIAATSQAVTCDTVALPDTPVNMSEQSDLVTSDSTLRESEANPSPAASLHVAGFGFANGLFQLLTNTMSIGSIQIILTN